MTTDLSPENTRTLDTKIRLLLLTHFIQHAWPLTPQELAEQTPYSLEQITASLHRLHNRRALVLFSDSADVLMMHPFSATPTAFRVEAQGRSWWASCAWCAFGIAALLGTDTTIYTVCGSCQRPIQWNIHSGEVEPTTDVIHFAMPPENGGRILRAPVSTSWPFILPNMSLPGPKYTIGRVLSFLQFRSGNLLKPGSLICSNQAPHPRPLRRWQQFLNTSDWLESFGIPTDKSPDGP